MELAITQNQHHPLVTQELTKAQERTKSENFLLKGILLLSDTLMVVTGLVLAYYIRFDVGSTWFNQNVVPNAQFYGGVMVTLLPLFLITFRAFGLYNLKQLFVGMGEYSKVLNAGTLGAMLIILVTFFVDGFIIARGWLVLSWLFIVSCVGIGRFIVRRIVQTFRTKGYFSTEILIIGANEEGQAIATQLLDDRKSGIQVVGFLDDNLPLGTEVLPEVFVLGSIDTTQVLVNHGGIKEVIIPATALPREKLLNLFQRLTIYENLTIRISSGLYELITTGVEVQKIGNVPLLSVNKVRLTGADVWLKTGLDLIISLMVLPFLILLCIPLAILIATESPGPILHRRRVVGVGGKQFDAFKFRTMHVDGDKRLTLEQKIQLEQHGKLKNDPRITLPGSILRKTSLDELPQILNVLRGEMSLVGPRMITYEEQEKYGKWRTNLVTVKPGITGLWQVSGRSDIGYEERVMLDMHYIRNYSIWFDLHILWRTIPAVLAKRGAY